MSKFIPSGVATPIEGFVSKNAVMLGGVAVLAVGGYLFIQNRNNAAANAANSGSNSDYGIYTPYSSPQAAVGGDTAGGVFGGTASGANPSTGSTSAIGAPLYDTSTNSPAQISSWDANATRVPLISSATGSPVVPGDPLATAQFDYESTLAQNNYNLSIAQLGLQTLQEQNNFTLASNTLATNATVSLAQVQAATSQAALYAQASEYGTLGGVINTFLNRGYGAIVGGATDSFGNSIGLSLAVSTGGNKQNAGTEELAKSGTFAFFNNVYQSNVARADTGQGSATGSIAPASTTASNVGSSSPQFTGFATPSGSSGPVQLTQQYAAPRSNAIGGGGSSGNNRNIASA